MRWLEMVLGLQVYSVLEGKFPYEFLPELSSSCQNEEKLHSLSSTMINHGVSRGVEMKTEPKTMAVQHRQLLPGSKTMLRKYCANVGHGVP
jgi:hypothetical protein